MRSARIARCLAAAALFGGCSDATAPRPVAVAIRTVNFTSEAERAAWPATPTVEGGATIRVRGLAGSAPCVFPTATAVRHGKRIDLAIDAGDSGVYCIDDLVATSPAFEATVSGIEAGQYLVHVTVSSYPGSAEWVVTVIDGATPLASR